jgi:glycosyltransferase involved in cell wall biosynthesis
MSSLSVAHVTNIIGGGMGTVFRVLLPAQVRRGDRVCLFVREAGADDLAHFSSHGVEVRKITSAAGLARQLRGYDVIHLHSADLGLLVAGWLSRRPTVFTLHGLRAQTRPMTTVSPRRLPTLGGVRRRCKRVGFSVLLRYAMTRVTTVSEFLAEKATALYGVDPASVTVVYSGIDVEQFKGSPRESRDTGPVIGWMGRLVPVKRVDMLLRAVASAKAYGAPAGMRVVIVGDGRLKAELVQLVRSLGIGEWVDFVGHVSTPQAVLAEMDLFVFPSRDEGAALAVNEAMASGLPVVVMQDGGGVVELIERSGGGLVVPDEGALARAIVELLRDAPRCRQMAEKAVAYAVRELDPLAWAARLDGVYRAARA